MLAKGLVHRLVKFWNTLPKNVKTLFFGLFRKNCRCSEHLYIKHCISVPNIINTVFFNYHGRISLSSTLKGKKHINTTMLYFTE